MDGKLWRILLAKTYISKQWGSLLKSKQLKNNNFNLVGDEGQLEDCSFVKHVS